ncbi:rep protein, partial [Escherichia coli]|nr:rep protein [Escherichia coli]
MCKCNTVTRDDIPFAIWSGLRPDTPYQCVRAQCGFRFSSASSPTRSLTFGRWGCGERCHLSHVVGDSAVALSGMSRQIAPQTRSEALRRTKRVLNARQGMEGAKNAYRESQEVRRADTPNQGLSGRQEPRQPAAKPICTEQAATRLAGGRRPSVLLRWGCGVPPRRFPVALKALPEPWR